MDAQQALADLTEISSQVRAAVIFDEQGNVAGSTFDDATRAEALARSAADLLAVADSVKSDGVELTQLEAATAEGSVFVVRQGPTRIAATTGAAPTVGLVFYDLKSALRNLEKEEPQAPAKRAPRKKAASTAAKKPAADKKATAEKKSATTSRKPATRRKTDET